MNGIFTGGKINGATDMDFSTKVYGGQHLHTGVGKIEQVFESYNHFATHSSQSHVYAGFWWNSSSYMRGLLSSVNIEPTLKSGFKTGGWNNIIPVSRFGGVRK